MKISNRDRVHVNRNGDWKRFIQILQHYQTPFGTVRIGAREGALAYDHQLGCYVMITMGRTHDQTPLNDRKVRAALGLPERADIERAGT